MKRPAFQFYPADWRKDVELQSCSMAAQGLWINAMCVAHECEPYGHLALNGRAMNHAQIGRQVGLSARETETLLIELLDSGAARQTADGVIFSKRMVDDEDLRNRRAAGGNAGAEHGVKGAEAGKKGGRPKEARGDKEPPLMDPLNPPPSSSSSSSTSVSISEAIASVSAGPTSGTPGKAKLPPCPCEQIVGLYVELLPELPGVRVLDDARRKAIRGLWAFALTTTRPDGTPRATGAVSAIEWVREFFTLARSNDFVMGRTERGESHKNWRADIEYLCSSRGIKQVLEKTETTS